MSYDKVGNGADVEALTESPEHTEKENVQSIAACSFCEQNRARLRIIATAERAE